MIHFFLLLVCILSIEVIIRLDFLSLLDLILRVANKVTNVFSKKNVSDHWKEKAILAYAFRIMKYSLQILLILILILSIFAIVELFFNNFLEFTLSLFGILESLIFVFGYAYLRKLFVK